MTEEMQKAIEQATRDKEYAKKALLEAKKKVFDKQSIYLEQSLKLERLLEKMEEYKNVTPKYDPSLRDLDIDGFRERNSDICEFARERDNKESENE